VDHGRRQDQRRAGHRRRARWRLQQQFPGGDYSNNFADISGPIIINGNGDAITNYLDGGAATNGPSRYYRIRLVP